MRTMGRMMATAAVAAAGWMAAGAALAEPSQAEQKAVWDDVGKAAKKGPVDVPLAGQAVMHLPAGEVFVPQPQANRMLNMMGNPGNDPRLQGVILPTDEHAQWFMPVRFESAGYIKDDDAKHWNADDMLKTFRDGTAEANKEREKMGVPGLDIVGWAEPPTYDAARQRLVWALTGREIGAAANAPQNVNYNTYALGRDGFFSLNMVTSLPQLDALKPVAQQQLAALEYNPGKHYADFNEKTDHVAEYGLAALVVGVAAHKLGFIAIVGLFLAKFAKIILIALAAFGGGFLKYFKRKPKVAPEVRSSLRAPAAIDAAPAAAAPVAPLPPLEFDAGSAPPPPTPPLGGVTSAGGPAGAP